MDRLIAEVILLVGTVYLSITLFTLVSHFTTYIDYAHYLNEVSRAYVYVPDAVIVNNGTKNEVYLVVYNEGDEPITLRGLYGNCSGDSLILNQAISGTILRPSQYVLLSGITNGSSCNLSIMFCIENTTLCMLYPIRTTSFTLQG